MSNKHQYSSDVTETHQFTSKLNNIHSFASDITNSRIYNIIVSAFTASTSLFVKVVNNNIVTIKPIRSVAHLSINVVNNNIVTFNNAIAKYSSHLSVNVVNNNIVTTIIKSFSHMNNVAVVLSNNVTARIGSTGHIKNVNTIASHNIVTATITGKKYYLLSDWDGNNLNTLDSMNLSAMDYQIV
jgi:hypothetical protein